jgi:hypothetical protein
MGLEVAKLKFDKAIEKVKHFIVGDTKQKKLDIILNHLIDTIELRGNDVLITTKKNIAIQNDGHLVQINSGAHVMLSKEIHLNPKIKFNINSNFETVQGDLDYARELEEIELKEKLEEFQKNHKSDCKH